MLAVHWTDSHISSSSGCSVTRETNWHWPEVFCFCFVFFWYVFKFQLVQQEFEFNTNIFSCWIESSWNVCTFRVPTDAGGYRTLFSLVLVYSTIWLAGVLFGQLHLDGHPWGSFFLRLVTVLKLLASWATHVESPSEATVWQMWTVIFLLLSSSDICLHQPLWMKFPAQKCEFIFIFSLSKMYFTELWV